VIERLLLAALLWGAIGLCLWSLRRQSPLHALTLALLATGLAGTFFPLLSLWTTPVSWRNLSGISESSVLAQQLDYLACGAGLALACWYAWSRGWIARRAAAGTQHAGTSHSPATPGMPAAPPRGRATRDRVVAFGLTAGGLALYALYIRQVGLAVLVQRDDYAQKYLASQGLGMLSFGLQLCLLGVLWAEAAPWRAASKWPYRAIGLAVMVWTLMYLTVRTNFVILLVGWLCIACRHHGLQLRRLRPWLVCVLLVAWAGLETFSVFRGAFRGDLGEALTRVLELQTGRAATLAGSSELAHPFLTALEVREVEEPASELGASYLRAVTCLAPLALFPDRPPTLAERFARRHYSVLAAAGGGTAYSLVAEAWINFGPLVGPLLVGIAIGLLCAWLEWRVRLDPHGIAARLLPFWLFSIVVLHRSESAMLLKTLLSSALPVLLLCVLAQLLASRPLGTRRVAPRARVVDLIPAPRARGGV
jgi:hypothetical protein